MKCEKTKITSTISEITMQPPKLPRPTLKTNISISAGCNFIFLHPHTQPHPRLLTISSPLHISPTHNNSTSLPFPCLGIIDESEKEGVELLVSFLSVRKLEREERDLRFSLSSIRELEKSLRPDFPHPAASQSKGERERASGLHFSGLPRGGK